MGSYMNPKPGVRFVPDAALCSDNTSTRGVDASCSFGASGLRPKAFRFRGGGGGKGTGLRFEC